MQFLTGSILTNAIKEILKEPDVCCAVAFWGKGCNDWLKGKNARVICNLASGGTNPFALKSLKLSNKGLKQNDQLHAKVFIGRTHTIVASANVSANGLGFEGIEQKGWLEAGVKIETTSEQIDWFESLWRSKICRPISLADWNEAIDAWESRKKLQQQLARRFTSTNLFEMCRQDPDLFKDVIVVHLGGRLSKNAAKVWKTKKQAVSSQRDQSEKGGNLSSLKAGLKGSLDGWQVTDLPHGSAFIALYKSKNGTKCVGAWANTNVVFKVKDENGDDETPLTIFRREQITILGKKISISSKEKNALVKISARLFKSVYCKTLPQALKMIEKAKVP
jgi:hypothetical protein